MDSKPVGKQVAETKDQNVEPKSFEPPESKAPVKIEVTLLGTRGSYTILVVALSENGKGCKNIPVLIDNEETNERVEAPKTDGQGLCRQDITVAKTTRIRVWVGQFVSNTNPRQFTLHGPRHIHQASEISPSTTVRGFLAPFLQGIREGLEAKKR